MNHVILPVAFLSTVAAVYYACCITQPKSHRKAKDEAKDEKAREPRRAIEATLADGTNIDITITPGLSPQAINTASNSSNTSFVFEVNTAPLESIIPPKTQCPTEHRTIPPNLTTPPSDVVAIDAADKTWLFYVTARNKLAYLVNSNSKGSGQFKAQHIMINDKEEVEVNAINKQIAAITWVGKNDQTEIRVYYVNESGILREVFKTGDKPWDHGVLSNSDTNPKHGVALNSPISATVHYRASDPSYRYDLRVYAVKAGQETEGGNLKPYEYNSFNNPIMSVYQFMFDEDSENTGVWAGQNITGKLPSYVPAEEE